MTANPHLSAFSMLLARDVEVAKIPMRRLQVLGEVIAQDKPVSVRQVARLIKVSDSWVSRIVDRLVEDGLLIRSNDEIGDRRLSLLTPTESGRKIDQRVRLYATSTAA